MVEDSLGLGKEYVMIDVFEDQELMHKYEDKPFHMAMFLALRDFVSAGHELSEIPWFSFCKKKF